MAVEQCASSGRYITSEVIGESHKTEALDSDAFDIVVNEHVIVARIHFTEDRSLYKLFCI